MLYHGTVYEPEGRVAKRRPATVAVRCCADGWVARGPATNVKVNLLLFDCVQKLTSWGGLVAFSVRYGNASALLRRATRFAYERMSLLAEKEGIRMSRAIGNSPNSTSSSVSLGGITGDSIELHKLSVG